MTRPYLPAILTISGGAFVLFMGLAVATPTNPASYLSVYVGPIAFVVGLLLIVAPSARRTFGVLSILLAPLSIPYSYGGLVVGAFLLVLGGVLAFVWVPAPEGRAAALRGSTSRPRR